MSPSNQRDGYIRQRNSDKRRRLRRYVFSTTDGICAICGLPVMLEGMTIDHIIPLSKGGKDERANMQPAHAQCNYAKADKTQIEDSTGGIMGYTDLERWFSRLPNIEMRDTCHCGSGHPVVYWSPEDGTCCRECKFSLAVYIPYAVMYNILSKFNIELSPEERKELYAMLDDPNEEE